MKTIIIEIQLKESAEPENMMRIAHMLLSSKLVNYLSIKSKVVETSYFRNSITLRR